MLEFTGHPFVDIGIAAIRAFVHKRSGEIITSKDLDTIATYIEQNYVRPPLRGYLTMAFTSNAWFIQDAFNPEKSALSEEERIQRRAVRDEWAHRHLRQWNIVHDPEASDTQIAEIETPSVKEGSNLLCMFTSQVAIDTTLSGKLLPGRAGRAQIPLLQGDEAINFFPYGFPGVPVSGTALLALQFFPLACARCGIGLLAIHSDNEALLYHLTSTILQQNMRAIVEAQAAHEDKLPRLPRSPKTLLVELLVELERQRSNREEDLEPASLTAYNFNNGKELDLAIYHLPIEIVQFLQIVATPTYKAAWDQLVQRSWQMAKTERADRRNHKHDKGNGKTGSSEKRNNFLYEDLFDLPSQTARFVRTYFLRIPRRTGIRDDPRKQYSLRKEINTVHWILLELFLERVVRMETARIEQIRNLGDGLALYVRRQGGWGKRFFRLFFTEQSPATFRGLLIKANIANMKDGQPSLFDLDTYIDVFEEGYEVMRPDWRLARDLVLIRMIDQLKDWLAQNPDATPEEEGRTDQTEAENRNEEETNTSVSSPL